MPILNHDILHEIFVETLEADYILSFSYSPKRKPLENFMLAGKETFQVALNYFGRSKCTELSYDGITLFIDYHGKIKRNQISYKFPLLSPILAKIGGAIDELEIYGSFSQNEKRCKIFDYLIRKDLENVRMDESFLDEYKNLLNPIKKIFSYYSKKPSSNKVGSMEVPLKIPMACKCLHLDRIHLTPFLLNNEAKNVLFPFVKTLVITGTFCNFDLTKINQLVNFVSSSFPKLLSLDILLDNKSCGWFNIEDTVFSLKSSTFNKLSSKVKGKIKFYADNSCKFFDDWLDGNDDPAETYDSVVDKIQNKSSSLIFNAKAETIQKTFSIHNGLDFEIFYWFDKLVDEDFF